MAELESTRHVLAKMPTVRRRALRSHEITHGLQSIDQRSAAVAKLDATCVIGWAAALSGNLREQEVGDLEALRAVASQTLGIQSLAFPEVLSTLQEAELATIQKRRGAKEVLYVSNATYATLYGWGTLPGRSRGQPARP